MMRGFSGGMLFLFIFSMGLIWSSSALADHTKYVKRAQSALIDAEDGVEDGSRTCRKSVGEDIGDALSQVRKLKSAATAKRLKRAYTFVSQLAKDAARARCPKEVRSDLSRARSALKKARLTFDDDDDNRPRRRSRSSGGGWRGDLSMAAKYIDDVLDDLDDAHDKCRNGVAANTRSAGRQIRSARRKTTQQQLNGLNGFMVGLNLAAGLSGCPNAVTNGINRAFSAVNRAKNSFANGGGSSSRSRRDDDDRSDSACVRYIKKAQKSMKSALYACKSKKVPSKCKEALAGNIRQSISEIGDLADDPRKKEIDDHQMFIAGMGIAGAVAKCPNSVMAPIGRAQTLLTKAKNRAR